MSQSLSASQFVVRHESPYAWKELDEAIEIEGIALAQGTFTGKDNITIHYPAAVIENAVDTLLGVPLFAHGHNGMPIGFVTGSKFENDRALYRALVLKPSAFIEAQESKGVSVEASVRTEWNPEKGVEEAKALRFEAVCLVDSPSVPACPECRITEVRKVELEDLGQQGQTSPIVELDCSSQRPKSPATEGGVKVEEEKIGIEDILSSLPEDVRLQYPKGFDTAKFQRVCTGIGVPADKCEALANILIGKWKYPIPGYPYYKAPKAEAPESEKSEVELALTEYNRFMRDCIKAGKTFKECAAEWRAKKKMTIPELDEALDNIAALDQQAALSKLIEKVVALDKDFCVKCLDDLPTFETKKTYLEAYIRALEKSQEAANKSKLEVDESSQRLERANKAAKELFGITYEDLMKEVTH